MPLRHECTTLTEIEERFDARSIIVQCREEAVDRSGVVSAANATVARTDESGCIVGIRFAGGVGILFRLARVSLLYLNTILFVNISIYLKSQPASAYQVEDGRQVNGGVGGDFRGPFFEIHQRFRRL